VSVLLQVKFTRGTLSVDILESAFMSVLSYLRVSLRDSLLILEDVVPLVTFGDSRWRSRFCLVQHRPVLIWRRVVIVLSFVGRGEVSSLFTVKSPVCYSAIVLSHISTRHSILPNLWLHFRSIFS